MRSIIRNLAVEYEEQGSGPVVLMLHGWKQDVHTFDAITPALASAFRVIRLDLPGFGGSETPPVGWNVSEYVVFVATFIQKLGITVDVLVGHSFGGRIALKGLGGGVLKARRLVLVGSAGLTKKDTLRNHLFLVVAKIGKAGSAFLPFSLREHLRRRLYTRAGSDLLDAGAMKETFLLTRGEELSSFAQKVRVPTLLIWGEEDSQTPLDQGKRFAELISGAKLVVLPKAGHFVHQEKAAEVAKLILDFSTV